MNIDKCPICRGKLIKLHDDRFLQCRFCGTVFNSAYFPDKYSDEYFTTDYRKQYGKTYEDDYCNIREFSLKRLKNIFSLINAENTKSIVDVGSALGFFLETAYDLGIKDCTSLEVSKYAVDYIRIHYPFKIINNSFDLYIPDQKYDIVTAWYYIEHTADICGTIEKLSSMVSANGILAFSVPSSFSPMFYFMRNNFFTNHPKDHRADLTPKSVKIILKQLGYRKIVIRPASYHPERIVSKNKIYFKIFSAIYRFFSDITGFSDTIEVYALK